MKSGKKPRKRPTSRKPVRTSAKVPARPAPRPIERMYVTETRPESGLLIVAVGASAGGLEACSQLLEALPEKPGFAMVLVQHLAPQHESALPTLLSARTSLEVLQAAEGMRVERDHVYVIPPNIQMGIAERPPAPARRGRATLAVQPDRLLLPLAGRGRAGPRHRRDPLRHGVRRRARACATSRRRAAPSSRRSRRPRSTTACRAPRSRPAWSTSSCRPAEIAPSWRGSRAIPLHARAAPGAADTVDDPIRGARRGALEQIFGLLRRPRASISGTTSCRPSSAACSAGWCCTSWTASSSTLKLLREGPREVQLLYQDILIHVTRFFREPESFEAIESQVLPKITRVAAARSSRSASGCRDARPAKKPIRSR